MAKRFITMLTIAGADPTGGAGIAADVRTAAALGVYAMPVVTSITSQNPRSYNGAMHVGADMLRSQLRDVMDHYAVDAMKSGMMPTTEQMAAVRDVLRTRPRIPYVMDPVIRATTGGVMMEDEAVRAIVDLMPYVSIITPNAAEVRRLTDIVPNSDEDRLVAAEWFFERGAEAVILKGGDEMVTTETQFERTMIGDMTPTESRCIDFFIAADGTRLAIESQRIATTNLHGTGCTLSAAIASHLATGQSKVDAVVWAMEYVQRAIEEGADLRTTSTYGPLCHGFAPRAQRLTEAEDKE